MHAMASPEVAIRAPAGLFTPDATFVSPTDTEVDAPPPSRIMAARAAARREAGKRNRRRGEDADVVGGGSDSDDAIAFGGMGARFGRRGGGGGGGGSGGKRRRGVPMPGDRARAAAMYTQVNPAAAGGRPVLHSHAGRALGVMLDPVSALDASNAEGGGGGDGGVDPAFGSDLPMDAAKVAQLSMTEIVRYMMDYSHIPHENLMKGRVKNRLVTHIQSTGALVPGTWEAADSKHRSAGYVRSGYAAGYRSNALSTLAEVDPAYRSVQDMYDARPPQRTSLDALASDPDDGLAFGGGGRHADGAREGVSAAERARQEVLQQLRLQERMLQDVTERYNASLVEANDAREAWIAEHNRVVAADSDGDDDNILDDDAPLEAFNEDDVPDADSDDEEDKLLRDARLAVVRMTKAREMQGVQAELVEGTNREVARLTKEVQNAAARASRPRERTARLTRDQAAVGVAVMGRPPSGALAAAAATHKWSGSPWAKLNPQLVSAIQTAYEQIRASTSSGFARPDGGGSFRTPTEEECMGHADLITPFFNVVKAVGIQDRGKSGRMARQFNKDAFDNKVDVSAATFAFLDAMQRAGVATL